MAAAEEAAAEPSYLQQLRRVQALSLSEQQQQSPGEQQPAAAQQQQQQQQAGAPSGGAEPSTHQQQQGQQGRQQPAAFELRIIEEPVALRPHALAYGVPFDFVDDSEGSALDRLMAQAGEAGGAGAADLWAALAACQGGGAGAGGAS